MPLTLSKNTDYKKWVVTIKNEIRSAQLKSAITVNTALINFYWQLGKSIVEKQHTHNWGTGTIDQLAFDLKKEFPNTDGFSRSNLYNIKQFYLFYSEIPFVQQGVGQIPYSNKLKNNSIKNAVNSTLKLMNIWLQIILH